MGHYGEFGCALWATTANLVVLCGPLRRIWFYAMGQYGGFGYALWAIARNEVVQ
jgi:heme exporter protein D